MNSTLYGRKVVEIVIDHRFYSGEPFVAHAEFEDNGDWLTIQDCAALLKNPDVIEAMHEKASNAWDKYVENFYSDPKMVPASHYEAFDLRS